MSVVMDSSVQTNRQLQLSYRSAAGEVTRANLLELLATRQIVEGLYPELVIERGAADS